MHIPPISVCVPCSVGSDQVMFALQMTWWQTNGWTSRLQWPTSCPPALPTSSPAPSARPAWTIPARGRGAAPTTSKDTREENGMRKDGKWIRMKHWKGSGKLLWCEGNRWHQGKKSQWVEGESRRRRSGLFYHVTDFIVYQHNCSCAASVSSYDFFLCAIKHCQLPLSNYSAPLPRPHNLIITFVFLCRIDGFSFE